eukprot:11827873-Alexandrium_andersonii.AAC.1
MRDSGGHLTSTARFVGATLKRRLEATMQTVARIATLPLDQEAGPGPSTARWFRDSRTVCTPSRSATARR